MDSFFLDKKRKKSYFFEPKWNLHWGFFVTHFGDWSYINLRDHTIEIITNICQVEKHRDQWRAKTSFHSHRNKLRELQLSELVSMESMLYQVLLICLLFGYLGIYIRVITRLSLWYNKLITYICDFALLIVPKLLLFGFWHGYISSKIANLLAEFSQYGWNVLL